MAGIDPSTKAPHVWLTYDLARSAWKSGRQRRSDHLRSLAELNLRKFLALFQSAPYLRHFQLI